MPDPDEVRQSKNHLTELLRRDREAMADFVVALSDFDRRRFWVDLGFNCLFNFLHHGLRMSRSAAHYRRVAAELAQRFPEIIEPLRDGRLCISVVSEVAKVLTEQDRSVLERFFWVSVDKAREIAAELNPILDPPRREVITAVQPTMSRAKAQLAAAADRAPSLAMGSGVDSPGELRDPDQLSASVGSAAGGAKTPPSAPVAGPEPLSSGVSATNASSSTLGGIASSATVDPFAPVAPAAPIGPSTPMTSHGTSAYVATPDDVTEVWTEPLGRNLYRLHVTVTQTFMEKLDAARDALAFKKIRKRADVIEAALDLVLATQAKRRGETNRPQQNPRPAKNDAAHIPARVKRAVGRRDRWQCQFPTDSGGICGSKRNIQFDHIVPSILGGPSTVENVRVLCATHNVVAARLVLGDDVMDRYTRRGRRGEAANDAPPGEKKTG